MGIVAVIAATAFVASTALSVAAQRSAARKQRRLLEVKQRRAQISQIREGRRLRAQAINIGAQTGGAGGSGLAGAVGSITSQLAGNLTFLDVTGNLQVGITRSLAAAQTFGAIANFSSAAFSGAGGIEAIGEKF